MLKITGRPITRHFSKFINLYNVQASSIQNEPINSRKMAANLILEPFHGKSTDDIKRWLQRFAHYSGALGLSEDQKLASLTFHIQGNTHRFGTKASLVK